MALAIFTGGEPVFREALKSAVLKPENAFSRFQLRFILTAPTSEIYPQLEGCQNRSARYSGCKLGRARPVLVSIKTITIAGAAFTDAY